MLKPGDKLPPISGQSLNGSYIRLNAEHLPPGGAVIVIASSESKLKPFEKLLDEFNKLKSTVLAILPRKPPARKRQAKHGRLTVVYDPGLDYLARIGLARRAFFSILRVNDAVIIVDNSLKIKAIIRGSRFEALALAALEALRKNLEES
ncbi:hypothetical protein [Aeropyrum camini]|uniref:Peroxiredoxin n=1 Tax=Aeropyrum camini SY1 = JCM 12091 TaxID=1198449 RepID=U3TDU7_9CREN|nr:hypothetical protein [Aeropyrum camini]BAN89534.1 peroxiredoxin [Aeropyrum camini SY1 = JCM 12091]